MTEELSGSKRHETYLNEVLAIGFSDKRLKFGCGEGIDKTSLRNDEQEHLGASEDRQFVCLSEDNAEVSEDVSTRKIHEYRVLIDFRRRKLRSPSSKHIADSPSS